MQGAVSYTYSYCVRRDTILCHRVYELTVNKQNNDDDDIDNKKKSNQTKNNCPKGKKTSFTLNRKITLDYEIKTRVKCSLFYKKNCKHNRWLSK